MSSIYNRNLGKKTKYISTYDPTLLDPIPRKFGRESISIDNNKLPFSGYDLWTSFELSWLNSKGKPMIGIAEFKIPAQSENIIESKSFKLYLNTLNQSKFDSLLSLTSKLKEDLCLAVDEEVGVEIFSACDSYSHQIKEPKSQCIDDIDIEIDDYGFNSDLLLNSTTSNSIVTERLHSNLLKSNCLVTNQPDWGSLFVSYTGNKIDKEKLLRYLISFREHNEFHEQCVERIFTDIKKYCLPDKLTVFARYTRRGGLDINPFRSDFEESATIGRLIRQ